MRPPYYKIPDMGDPSDVLQLFPRYNIQLLCCRYWWLKKWEFKELSFPYWRIYYNKLEGARIFFKDYEYALTPSKIILIAPNTSFETQLAGQIEKNRDYELKGGRVDKHVTEEEISHLGGVLHLFIHFNLGMPYDNISPGIFVFDLTSDLEKKITRIINHLSVNSSSFSFYSSLAIQSLIGELLSDIPESRWDLVSKDFRILEVIEFIENHLADALNNDTLASQINMATNAFTRLFTTETGQSPQRYIKKKRIENACILLHHTNHTIDQVALETGFADRFHFSRIFKYITGISPARYRKEFEITQISR